MDPVSRLLVDRERSQPRLLPWIIVAVLLHAGAAAATYLVGKRAAMRPIQLPVVAVKLVRPQPPSRRPPSREQQRRSSPVPQATKAPATAVPKATSAPPTAPPSKPEVEAPSASEDAMRSADSSSTPAPTPPPSEPSSGGGPGLSVGESAAGGGVPGIPSDFHFTYYVQRMLTLIESRWYKPAVAAGTRTRVRFVILKDGRVEGIQLEESSGMPSFDRAALRAMYAANPLPPLPPAYGKSSLTIHLSFTE